MLPFLNSLQRKNISMLIIPQIFVSLVLASLNIQISCTTTCWTSLSGYFEGFLPTHFSEIELRVCLPKTSLPQACSPCLE